MSETKQRPTPETDAQAFCRSKAKGWVAPGKEAVAADFARRLERQRDQALAALRRLHDAAEVYSADQAYAPHPHIAAVQPVEPADGVALNEALAEAARVLGIEADSPMWPESRSASACANKEADRT